MIVVRGQSGREKELERPHLNLLKLGLVVHTCDSSNGGGMDRRIMILHQPGQKARPYLKNNLKNKGSEV
jgi:hypothetical protein